MPRNNRLFYEAYRANVDCNKLKTRTHDGRQFLVGPVVMARQFVMNELFYPADELQKATAAWNGRPVTVGHPKDDDGRFISANSPDILAKTQIGIVFGSAFNEDSAKLKGEIWLEVSKLKNFPKVQKLIDNGKMLEVSTGLFLDRDPDTGEYEGKEYAGIARNHRPDHLALLPDEIGACSVADGAGFPRANAADPKDTEDVDVNEVGYSEKFKMIGSALRKSRKDYPILEEVYDNHVIFSVYNGDVGAYELFRLPYKIVQDNTCKFKGEPVRVMRKVTYEDAPDTNSNKTKTQGGHNMTRKEKVDALISGGKFAANQADWLTGLTDEQFEAIEKAIPAANAKPEEKKVETPAPAANADVAEWQKKLYDERRAELVEAISANAQNPYTKDELAAMPMTQLDKLARLARTPDFSGRGGAGGMPAANKKEDDEEAPYVAPEVNTKARK